MDGRGAGAGWGALPDAGGPGGLSGGPEPEGALPGDPGHLPAEPALLLRRPAGGQDGAGGHAGRLAAAPAGKGLLPPDGKCPAVHGQQSDGFFGPPGPAVHGHPGGGAGPARADPGGISAAAVHRPGAGQGAAIPAGEALWLHRPGAERPAQADGTGGAAEQGDAGAPARLSPPGAAGLRQGPGDRLRPPVSDQERQAPAADRRHRRHEAAVPGRPGGGGKGEPQVPETPVENDPGGRIRPPGAAGPAGGGAVSGDGTAHCGLEAGKEVRRGDATGRRPSGKHRF